MFYMGSFGFGGAGKAVIALARRSRARLRSGHGHRTDWAANQGDGRIDPGCGLVADGVPVAIGWPGTAHPFEEPSIIIVTGYSLGWHGVCSAGLFP